MTASVSGRHTAKYLPATPSRTGGGGLAFAASQPTRMEVVGEPTGDAVSAFGAVQEMTAAASGPETGQDALAGVPVRCEGRESTCSGGAAVVRVYAFARKPGVSGQRL